MKAHDPWPADDEKPQRRADKEKAERKALSSIPPVNVIRRPLELPPMERVQDS